MTEIVLSHDRFNTMAMPSCEIDDWDKRSYAKG